MSQFGKSQTLKRLEDPRLLTGRGRYVDDNAPEGALFAVFVRSNMAHADIAELDLEAARAAPGVVAVYAAADLEAAGLNLMMTADVVRNRDKTRGAAPDRPVLARNRVRFVGEAVAVVIAETPDQGRDAAELVELDLDERECHIDRRQGGPLVHDDVPENVAFDWERGDPDGTEAALAASAHVVSMRVDHNRIIVNSMEPRGAWAEWDGERLHLCFGGQGVWDIKDELAHATGLAQDQLRVTTEDVGGGFGMKGCPYPEYAVVAQAARMLGRPVRWMSDRGEAMLSDTGGRDLNAFAELGFDESHKITAYRVRVLSNLGAYNSFFGQHIQSNLFSRVLTGAYDIRTVHLATTGIYTNTAPVDAYRGAGRPEAITTIERVMDMAARELGVDPWELREKNFIREFPYKSATGDLYDVGDFPRVIGRVRQEASVTDFPARRAESEKAGKLRGLGLCYYIESILGSPEENAAIEFAEDGTVNLYVGTQSGGQGHETAFAQFLSDRTGIPVADIRVVQGDSDRIAKGGGTGGSRSATVQLSATIAAVETMVAAYMPFLADSLGVKEADIDFSEGGFRAPGSNVVLTMMEAAARARAAGRSDLLRHDAHMRLPGRSYPNGAHVAEVEVDPETGMTKLVGYTVTDDFGNLINPMLVEGQVHGGVAQGVGQAILEQAIHDADGQLLTASFMDYAIPRAGDMPMIRFTTEPVPSTANLLGMKGCGEAGTVGALAAVSNAVLDALWDRGVKTVTMPFTPLRVWQMLEEVRGG